MSTFTLPSAARPESYAGILGGAEVYRAVGNSLFASVISVLFILLLAFPVSYLLARFTFRGKNALRLYFVAGLLVPTYGLLVPVFVLFKNIGMLNNRFTILFPLVAFNLPIAIFLLESYIQTIPLEIEESVFIDGALLRQRLWHVVVPMSSPIMATVVIVDALSTWNEFGFPLVLLRGQQYRTVPLWLNTFVGEHTVSYPALMAAMFVASLPVVLTYLFLNRRIIEGMTAGALRG
jgi:raffinose/stachyose/melibiose transport system permease protein